VRYQVRRGLRVVLLVPPIAFLFGAGSATAGYAASAAGPVTGTSGVTYTPLPDNTPVMSYSTEQDAPVLTTLPFMMQQGDVLRVTDQLEVRIPSGDGSQTNNELVCYGQRPNPSGGKPIQDAIGQVSTGTNVGAGVNGSDAYQWNVSMLITPQAQDSPAGYYCQIVTYVANKDAGSVMDVLAPAPGQTTYGTWLQVSSGSEVGAQEWQFFTCNTQATLKTCCTPEDVNHTCQYIGGGSGRPPAIDLPASPSSPWLAAPDATTFDAVATFMITDCWGHFGGLFGGTDACLANDRGDGIFGMSGAEGQTWLEVDQLSPDGSVCAVNRAYPEESTGGQVQLSESYYDSDNQHHLPLYYDLSAPVSQLCRGSRLFTVDLHIGWTAGNPVKLDGGNINVIDSGYARTTVVPDVIGRTQAQADDAIEANGLTTWPAPDYVASTAPVGTVLDENSPAGTIEPAGSPVQLTVSLGYATVPNVVGDPVAKAEAAIRSAGLTPAVNSSVSNCVHPGIVLGQTPPGGTQVTPGSTVGIGITVCTR
jgi:PASTA domain